MSVAASQRASLARRLRADHRTRSARRGRCTHGGRMRRNRTLGDGRAILRSVSTRLRSYGGTPQEHRRCLPSLTCYNTRALFSVALLNLLAVPANAYKTVGLQPAGIQAGL